MTPKIYPRGKKWILKYDDPTTIQNPDGTTEKKRNDTSRVFDTKREAEARRAVIMMAHAKGERFIEAKHRPVSRLSAVVLEYAAAAANVNTARTRGSMLNKFLAFVGENATADGLSADLLREYGQHISGELKRADRYVGEVEAMWEWAHQGDTPGVPQPRRIVGREFPRAIPVYVADAPTWDDCDAMIGHLDGWHRRVATVLRYTGLRASQVLTLGRSDIRLDAGFLRIRANARGAKGIGRHRAVPVHAALANELACWELPDAGPIFVSRDVRRVAGPGVWREDALREPFTRAWRLAKVTESKWGAPEDDEGGRVHGRPTHAFRSAFKSGLLREGVSDVVANLLIGHSTGATQGAYIPEGSPTPC